jgi:hypothetical protein
VEILLRDWLSLLDEEYLRAFVPAGGASLKCAVSVDAQAAALLPRELERLATAGGYHFCAISAATTRIHMIERLFHQIAQEIDWPALAAGYLRGLLRADGFALSEDRSAFTYAAIAELNGIEEPEVRRRVRAILRDHVARDYAMTREFRTAMLRLCQAGLETGVSEREEAEAIVAWLRGELRLISALRFARIFQKIGRNNARDMFLSLAHWLRVVGKSGLVLVLDISRYLLDRRHLDVEGGLFYSLPATLDAYEVLRQFIDAIGDLESCLIVVIAPPAFITDDRRGLAKYDALKLRIWEDVHDRFRANPLSGLVRLRAQAADAAS